MIDCAFRVEGIFLVKKIFSFEIPRSNYSGTDV